MKKYLMFMVLILTLFIPQVSWGICGICGGQPQPTDFTFEDLRNGIRDQTFYFANVSKPVNAMVNLGYFSFYPASNGKFVSVRNSIRSNPGKYRVNFYRSSPNWNDSREINFDWSTYQRNGGSRGDLVFTRGNGKAPDFVKLFSQWTHVAITNDQSRSEVFESTPDTNVKLNYTPSTWNRLTYFTCKKITSLNYQQVWSALNAAINNFTGKPYLPKVSTVVDLLTFLYRWSDKNDMESMYCSKLVYLTFKNYLNLDSDDTSTYTNKLQNSPWAAPIFSWIGVSPDDVYYSQYLGPDFNYSTNINYL